MLYIHPEECVDCGACEPVCPVEAIFYGDDVPAPGRTSLPPTRPSSPRARSRSAPRAGRPTSAPWCATSPSSPTTRCLTASSQPTSMAERCASRRKRRPRKPVPRPVGWHLGGVGLAQADQVGGGGGGGALRAG